VLDEEILYYRGLESYQDELQEYAKIYSVPLKKIEVTFA